MANIVNKNGISSIAVDSTNTQAILYWATSDGSIDASDYEGNNHRNIKQISSSIVSLAVTDNVLAWLTSAYWTSGGSLFITDNSVGLPSTYVKSIPFKNPKRIKPLFAQYNITNENACEGHRNPCQHLCLLNIELRASCACQIGWQLSKNSKTCYPVDEFVLYTQGDFIRGKILDVKEQAFTDAIWPTMLPNITLNNKRTVDFDYDLRANIFLFADSDKVYQKNVITKRPMKIRKFKHTGLRSIAVDWMSSNVYVTIDAGRYVNAHIKIFNYKKHDIVHLVPLDSQIHKIKCLAIHPNRGYLFFIALHDERKVAKIVRMHADGTKAEEIGKYQLDNFDSDIEFGIAIDYTEDRIYWVSGGRVRHAKLDGSDLKTIDVSVLKNPRSISVQQDWMYIANLSSIWRFDKQSSEAAIRIAPRFGNSINQPISSVKIYSPNVQKVNYNHPCRLNNGGCEDFCFAVPLVMNNGSLNNTSQLQKVCACQRDKNIQHDGISCF